MPKKNEPLNIEEMTEAADEFFPLFDVVLPKMKMRGGSVEDALKVMETIAKLGHKRREDKLAKEKELAFGFNKKEDDKDA